MDLLEMDFQEPSPSDSTDPTYHDGYIPSRPQQIGVSPFKRLTSYVGTKGGFSLWDPDKTDGPEIPQQQSPPPLSSQYTFFHEEEVMDRKSSSGKENDQLPKLEPWFNAQSLSAPSSLDTTLTFQNNLALPRSNPRPIPSPSTNPPFHSAFSSIASTPQSSVPHTLIDLDLTPSNPSSWYDSPSYGADPADVPMRSIHHHDSNGLFDTRPSRSGSTSSASSVYGAGHLYQPFEQLHLSDPADSGVISSSAPHQRSRNLSHLPSPLVYDHQSDSSESEPLPPARRRSASMSVDVGREREGSDEPMEDDDDVVTCGEYTRAERRLKVERYRAKRERRSFKKQIMYECRKTFADKRPRVGGRFVKVDKTTQKPEKPKAKETTRKGTRSKTKANKAGKSTKTKASGMKKVS